VSVIPVVSIASVVVLNGQHAGTSEYQAAWLVDDEDEDDDEAMEEEVMGGAGGALGEDDDVGSGGGLDVPDMDDAGELWMWDACIGVDGRVFVRLGESVAVCKEYDICEAHISDGFLTVHRCLLHGLLHGVQAACRWLTWNSGHAWGALSARFNDWGYCIGGLSLQTVVCASWWDYLQTLCKVFKGSFKSCIT
jgi:hypothetical protein